LVDPIAGEINVVNDVNYGELLENGWCGST
jgi:hypothetical protein